MGSEYFVRLEKFEGPLDLLLHLIKAQELEIFDVDVFVLTQQYLEYLRLVQFRDLQDAAAFLEMAATLCELKSRNLLPGASSAEQEQAEDEDPAATLQQRLFDYDMFKKIADQLGRHSLGGDLLATNWEWKRLTPQFEALEGPLRGDATTLLVLYEQMLGRIAERKPTRVTAMQESMTVDEVIIKVRKYIEKLQFLLFQDMYDQFDTRYEFVAHILAILQLVRDRQAKVHQETLMGPLWMYDMALVQEELPFIQQATPPPQQPSPSPSPTPNNEVTP